MTPPVADSAAALEQARYALREQAEQIRRLRDELAVVEDHRDVAAAEAVQARRLVQAVLDLCDRSRPCAYLAECEEHRTVSVVAIRRALGVGEQP